MKAAYHTKLSAFQSYAFSFSHHSERSLWTHSNMKNNWIFVPDEFVDAHTHTHTSPAWTEEAAVRAEEKKVIAKWNWKCWILTNHHILYNIRDTHTVVMKYAYTVVRDSRRLAISSVMLLQQQKWTADVVPTDVCLFECAISSDIPRVYQFHSSAVFFSFYCARWCAVAWRMVAHSYVSISKFIQNGWVHINFYSFAECDT